MMEEAQALQTGLEFCLLNPRVIKLWRLTSLVGFSILLLALLLGVLGWELVGSDYTLWFAAGWIALALLFGWFSYWYPTRSYRAWGYRIDAKVIEIRSGILFRVTRLLPLTRLQHVDLERGPFERIFGLTSLVLHTAGTHASTITIPGLDAYEAVRLRDHLVVIGGDDAV